MTLKVRKAASVVEKDKKGKAAKVEVPQAAAEAGERRAPTVSLDEIEEDSFSDDDDDEDEDDDFAADAVDNSSRDDDDDEDDDDDDSEPLLGKWFEETLQGEMVKGATDRQEENSGNGGGAASTELLLQDVSGNGLHVPDKGEPAGFISLASHIFLFMDKHMLAAESPYVKEYVSTKLSEQQMVVLATVIQDLDRDTNSASLKLEYHLASLYSEFSAALASFTHNVLAHGLLTAKLQNSLLSHLNVSPWQAEQAGAAAGSKWPLRVYPRTLAVLAQVLLLRQQQEGAAGGLYASKQTNVYIVIWGKVLASLTENILEPPPHENENLLDDINVEHAQLLLFLFHALALMQKKQILLMTANSICKAASVVEKGTRLTTGQILHLSRLVLFFEYLMRNLYEPPKELMEHVQSNIFRKYQNSGASVLGCHHGGGAPPLHFAFKQRWSTIRRPFDEDDARRYNIRIFEFNKENFRVELSTNINFSNFHNFTWTNG